MTKLLPSIALALALTAGIAAPALANDSFDSFDASYQLIRLHDAGINAVDVAEDTASIMRVTISQPDGGKTTALYDIDSLQPVRSGVSYDYEATGSIGAPTVQRSAPAAGVPQSLVWQGDGSF